MNKFFSISKIVLPVLLCLLVITGHSQTVPDGIIFQAIAKDPSGVPAKGRTIHIKDAVIRTTPSGTMVFSESFVVQASEDGVFTITIGKGDNRSGVSKLSDIDWSNGPFFLNIKAAIEPTILTPEWKVDEQYVDMGTSQFWTVPFAFTAARVAGFELMMKQADTTAMLAPYLRKTDTVSISNRINAMLKAADTSAMLNNFLLRLDTAYMLRNYIRKGDTNAVASLLGGKLSNADTASMLSNYLRKSDLAGINTGNSGASATGKLNIADTAAMLYNYLRKMDTSAMLLPYLQKKDTGSLSNRINAKLSFSDTSAMLAAYLRKTDTLSLSSRIETKLSISDTTSMLNSYLRKTDTASLSSRINNVRSYVDSSLAAGTVPDANTSTKGKIKLAGDLSGTADAPLIGDKKITAAKLADSTVTYAKMQRMGAKKLIGNTKDTAATGEEIVLGSGLRFNNDTLNTVATSTAAVDTFTANIIVYSTNGLGKYSQGQTIPAKGKTASQVLLDALTQSIPPSYTQPTVTLSSTPSAGTVEIGTSLSVSLSALFTQNDAGAQIATTYSKNGSALGSNTDNIASLTSGVSYTATITYGQGGVKNNNLGTPDPSGQIAAGSKTSSAVTFTPQAKRYWGYASSATPTDAEIRAAVGGGSELSGAKAKSSFDVAISSGANYIFYAYPSSLGALSSLSVGGFGSLPAFDLVTRSFTNTPGYTQSYNIYVSKNTFSATVSNIITN